MAKFINTEIILALEKTQFHTHVIYEKRSLKILLRDIPNYYLELAVKEEHQYQGFTVTHVRQFLKKSRKLTKVLTNQFYQTTMKAKKSLT